MYRNINVKDTNDVMNTHIKNKCVSKTPKTNLFLKIHTKYL